MTTLLPPLHPSPFRRRFERKRYRLDEASLSCSAAVNASSTTLGTIVVNRSRQVSPATVSSTPNLPNDENRSPSLSYSELLSSQRVTSLEGIRDFSSPSSFASKKPSAASEEAILDTSFAESASEIEQTIITDQERIDVLSISRPDPRDKYREGFAGEKFPTSIEKDTLKAWDSTAPSHNLATFPFQSHYFRSRDEELGTRLNRRGRLLSNVPEKEPGDQSSLSPGRASIFGRFRHRKRNSNVSSGFVHTVKTASLSNATFSIISRSLRLGHSSDTPGHQSSNPRYSIESDRPATTSSLDEAALHRGRNRRQILDEIILSEEGYVADLKALVFLYSTLLASASSLSNRARSSIQRNVIDLLHLHEQILELMHRSSFNATRRKWFDTASPQKLGINHHIRWRSLDSRAPFGHRKHRHTRSSFETGNPLLASAKARAAEPIEAADMARMFKGLMPRFFAYEEYCAKHEIMMHELHRKLPAWSDYGMGIESLAKSITALNNRLSEGTRALTVSDLLMKPIQRVCRYPLLLAELLKQTPVVDCPDSHAEIEAALYYFREAVREINLAADNPQARAQIQRRWFLHEQLNFNDATLQTSQFRMLGHATHCGVLHVAYQTRAHVDGGYALCILFGSHFVLAMPAGSTNKFNILAVIHLSDLKLESSCDGKGLQCHTALYTWKLCFEADGQLYEMILSACSASEEEAWTQGLRTDNAASNGELSAGPQIFSAIGIDLKPTGVVFGQAGTLTRRLSIQRAATVGNRASVCQVIIRGTHHPQDLQDFRNPYSTINRSQSHLTTHRTVVLAPKRSERAKLESSLAQVWTRDSLPFPGMTTSRGGQIIRASAGSLVRKLSLASIHTPFGRRSASLTLHTKKSSEASTELEREPHQVPVYEVKKDSHEIDSIVRQEADLDSEDFGDVDMEKEKEIPMQRVSSSTSKRMSLTGPEGLLRRGTKSKRRSSRAGVGLGPEDSAKKFYSVSAAVVDVGTQDDVDAVVEEKLRSKKRWSNPIGVLKGWTGEGIRHMLYSSHHK